ncbi:bifunctional phosphoglucose/phosphomannose isomerase [Candidatus Bathyarchaeota archaeon]|nr:bifunctional phosphoglucose/phosphomannose isomerase [Candidatus Bathyarchaeota archaeon]MBS7636688.1 bifunctional phosphoglucose/phosphomannose isomerase [Candidatus Bathyarchaeota archaeon]
MPKKSILDDLNFIKRIDKSGMLSFCVDAAKHYESAVNIAEKVVVGYPKLKSIIVAGMGGSAIGGELLKDWANDALTVPVEVCREYTLPAYVDKNTLVFAISYSGETEETLSAFLDAVKRDCMIICIGSGGTLLKFAEKLKIPSVHVPEGIPPRAALPYLFIPTLIILQKLGLVAKVKGEISEAVTVLRQVCSENAPEKPMKENSSKKIATGILGTVPIVYGFGFYRSVAQRFKQQFNENSKIPSKWEIFPELNHNEVVGWEKAEKLTNHFSAVIIRDKSEPEPIKCRIEATKELLSGKVRGIYEVWSRGEGRLAKMLSATIIGDFASIYLAVLRGVDPTPVKTISMLKDKVSKTRLKNKIVRELQVLVEKRS